jgi:hypothetical protein
VFDANLHCLLTLKRLQKQQLVEYADKVQGSIARRDKKDTAFEIMKTLSDDVPAFEFYKEMFPTTEMKVTLVSFYIQTLDLLWRLAKYSSLGFLGIFFTVTMRRWLTICSPTWRCSVSSSKVHLCEIHCANQGHRNQAEELV